MNCQEEKLRFINSVETRNKPFEEWINEVEKMMRLSVKEEIRSVVENGPENMYDLIN